MLEGWKISFSNVFIRLFMRQKLRLTNTCAFVYHNLCFEPVNQAVFGFPLCRLRWREFWKARTFSTDVKTFEFIYEVVKPMLQMTGSYSGLTFSSMAASLTCSFSKHSSIPCGNSKHYRNIKENVPLRSCRRDITSHLQRLKTSQANIKQNQYCHQETFTS